MDALQYVWLKKDSIAQKKEFVLLSAETES